jgi:hypothetical protein
MAQTPTWEANSHSVGQEIPCVLWNLKVPYRLHNSLALVLILSQMHTVHTFPLYFRKIQSNIIFPSTPRSSMWSLPFTFTNQNYVCISHISCACYVPRLYHRRWLDHRNNTLWSIQVMKLLIMQFSLASRHFLPPQNPVLKHPQSVLLLPINYGSADSYEQKCLWLNLSLLILYASLIVEDGHILRKWCSLLNFYIMLWWVFWCEYMMTTLQKLQHTL